MTRFLLFVAAAASLAAPLAAQTPPAPAIAPAPDAARVAIPFNPPLDRPLRYRATVTKTRNGTPVTVWIDYELRFTDRSEGFRLAVRTLNAGSPGMNAAQNAIVRRTIVDMTLPYVLRLNQAGVIEGMEGEEDYWNRTMALTERLVRQNVAGRGPTDEAALAHVIAMMRESSPQARLDMMTENIAPILQFGGMNLVVGQSHTSDDQVEGLMGMTLRQRSELRAERVENGRLTLSVRSSVPEDEVRRALEGFMARIPVTGQGHNNQAERERSAAQLRAARFDRQSDYAYEVALDSGLVHSGGGADRVIIDMGGSRREQRESYRIERRD